MHLFVCLFSIEIQTTGQIGMNFGIEMVLKGRKVLGEVTWYPNPQGAGCLKGVLGASGASSVCFGKNFIKQKLQGAPRFSGRRSPFWTPNQDLEGPGLHVILEPWSLTYEGEFIKSKL